MSKRLQVFTIYPNPASNQVNITLQGNWNDSISEIAIYDLLGKKIKNLKPVTSTMDVVVDISDIAAGIYLIEVIVGYAKTTKNLIIK